MTGRRQTWIGFGIKSIVMLALLFSTMAWFRNHYRIGLVGGIPCLPARMYLYRLTSAMEVGRGDQVVFKTDTRTAPRFPVGAHFVKLLQCLPGDEVEVDQACHVRCTGPDGPFYESELESGVLKILGKSCGDFAAKYRIPPGNFFVVGTYPHSYDSRYWGLVHSEQVLGKVVWSLWGYDSKTRDKEVAELMAAGKKSHVH